MGSLIYDLRKKIQNLTVEVNELDAKSFKIPELIDSANLLRTNNHLLEINKKNNELLLAYKEYSEELENLLNTLFSIQEDLTKVLKTQSNLFSQQKPTKKKTTPKKKSSKK